MQSMTTDIERRRQLGGYLVTGRLSWQSRLFRSAAKWLRSRLDYAKPIEEQRADFVKLTRQARMPRRVEVRDDVVEGLRAQWLIPAQTVPGRTIMHAHGGGWVLGSCDTHRAWVARIAVVCRARALLFDYRLAPEHPYPAALDDTAMMYRHLLQSGVDPGGIVLTGDSNGGTLVLSALVALRDAGDPLPAGAVCLSPTTDMTVSGETVKSHAGRAPFLKPEDLVGNPQYVGDNDPASPSLSPLFADLSGLPPLLIQVGYDEILLSDSTRFAERARRAGVDVTLEVWEGMWHAWHSFAPFLPEARRAIERIGAFVDRLQPEEGA
jgi:acetyl esterase/lipase